MIARVWFKKPSSLNVPHQLTAIQDCNEANVCVARTVQKMVMHETVTFSITGLTLRNSIHSSQITLLQLLQILSSVEANQSFLAWSILAFSKLLIICLLIHLDQVQTCQPNFSKMSTKICKMLKNEYKTPGCLKWPENAPKIFSRCARKILLSQ